MINYCAAGTSLDSFLKSMGLDSGKLVFPYEYFKSYDHLKETTEILPRECFYSQLKGELSQEDYDNLYVKKWKEYSCKNHLDWLKIYNEADVIPMAKAIEKQSKSYEMLEIDPFIDSMSISGASKNYVLNN